MGKGCQGCISGWVFWEHLHSVGVAGNGYAALGYYQYRKKEICCTLDHCRPNSRHNDCPFRCALLSAVTMPVRSPQLKSRPAPNAEKATPSPTLLPLPIHLLIPPYPPPPRSPSTPLLPSPHHPLLPPAPPPPPPPPCPLLLSISSYRLYSAQNTPFTPSANPATLPPQNTASAKLASTPLLQTIAPNPTTALQNTSRIAIRVHHIISRRRYARTWKTKTTTPRKKARTTRSGDAASAAVMRSRTGVAREVSWFRSGVRRRRRCCEGEEGSRRWDWRKEMRGGGRASKERRGG